MPNKSNNWKVLYKKPVEGLKSLISVLLKNRGIEGSRKVSDFLNPVDPMKIKLEEIGITKEIVSKIIKRIKEAIKNKEFAVVYGDYDADGITATAILWETLHEIGLDTLPFIPDRFEDGYGIKPHTVEKLKKEYPNLSLIITVDNGIVAFDGIKMAKELGIDVIVIDHHQKGSKKVSTDYLLHTTEVCGSALSWFFSREIVNDKSMVEDKLELACIGTIADQVPLTGASRSIVKFGLKSLSNTKRPGFLALFKESGISEIGPYEVGFVIAPRINSMGRLKHGLDSLRLICTKDRVKAQRLALDINEVNTDRQKIVDDVVNAALKENVENMNVIVLESPRYHEGVIGLAAAKLVEKFYRPAIVISQKEDISKASARSIAGFNIIEVIRKLKDYYIEGGGHPMAAGFSIKTKGIEKFKKKINEISESLLTKEILERKLRIDCKIDFEVINQGLVDEIKLFEPTGIGNPQPVFMTEGVEIANARLIGKDAKHLKLKLNQNEHIFDAIYFGGGKIYSELKPETKLNIAYSIEENIWNGYKNIQLKLKEIRLI